MYNSQYYTCEQIDERLLQGYLDDYNTQTGQSLTKAQFLTKLGSIFSKEGVIDNTATQIGYYECDTAAGTAAKTITVANYALFAGGSMKVKFANKNTANNATLNINSQGAKALYYQGERASATNSWDAEEVVEIYYDGTSYYANNVKGGSGSGVYDVSKEHPTSGPNSDGKFTLEYILNSSNVNELIPVNKRYPGMSIQFVSTSDNKYVQYRLMARNFTTDVTQWQGVVIESNPESKSLIESRGVFKDIHDNTRKFVASGVVEPLNFVENSIIHYDSEFEGSDNNLTGNIIPGANSVYVFPVDPTKKYYINRITKYYYDICLYDESMVFISTLYTYNQSIGQSSAWDMTVRIPSNCRYFAFERNYSVEPYVGYESNYSAWQNDGNWINTAQKQINVIDDEKNVMFRYINVVDGAKRYDNVTFENENQSTVNGVIIPSNKNIYICEINPSLLYYINRISRYYYNIVLYDNNMSFISTLYTYNQSIGQSSAWDMTVRIPSNCRYVAFIADYTEVLPYIGKEAEYIPWQNGKKYSESDSIILPLKHVDVFLPSDIYVANGRTIELYNNQVCLQADKVHIQWICSVGLALERKFSITAVSGTVGNNYPLTINVFDDDFNLLATKTITIHIVSNVIQSAKKIVNIGDSLSYSDKSQFSEMRLLSNQLLEFVGTKAYTATASDDVLYAGNIDGRPGFDTTKFLAGTGSSYYGEEHNSFWDGSKFNFSYYVANTLNNVAPDAVFIWLGTNEMNNLTTFLTNMQTIVDSVREYSNTIKIFIVNTIYRSNQNGIGRQGAVEGYNPSNGVFKYKEDYKVMEMMKNLYEQFNGESNIYVVPLALQMDSEYNYGQQEMDVNPRNTYKTIYPVDSIHPRKTGQLQTADVFFSMLCGLL